MNRLASLRPAALALLLAGCQRPVAVVAPRQALSSEMTHCPAQPDGSRVSDEAGATSYVLDLAATERACRNHLGATRRTLESEH